MSSYWSRIGFVVLALALRSPTGADDPDCIVFLSAHHLIAAQLGDRYRLAVGAMTSWKMMAIVGPGLSTLVGVALSAPGRAYMLRHLTCELHVRTSVQSGVLLAISVLTVAITLTFMTAALQNPEHAWLARTAWVVAILFFSPLSVPLYWFLHLRSTGMESGS